MRICSQCQTENRAVKKVCVACRYRLQGSPSPKAQRNKEIVALEGSKTYREIGEIYGISTGRAWQICKKATREQMMKRVFRVMGACATANCDCRNLNGKTVDGDNEVPLPHEGCTCVTLPVRVDLMERAIADGRLIWVNE